MAVEDQPLRNMAEAFKALADKIGSKSELELCSFSKACCHVSPLFRSLGIAFKFAELDYVAKVDDLLAASKSIVTLHVMIDHDIQANSVKTAGSHTRNLLRVKRGLDMVKVLFEQILATENNSLKDPASAAYTQVFAPFHGWAIRKAVTVGMYALPTKAQLLQKLNEDDFCFSVPYIFLRYDFLKPAFKPSRGTVFAEACILKLEEKRSSPKTSEGLMQWHSLLSLVEADDNHTAGL